MLEAKLAAVAWDLALPGDETLAVRPLDPTQPDALALEFDDLYADYIDDLEELPTADQLSALQALDSALTTISGAANSDLWTEAAIKSHPRWSEIRSLAQAVIQHYGS